MLLMYARLKKKKKKKTSPAVNPARSMTSAGGWDWRRLGRTTPGVLK
jgi:hypothetical protein